MTQVRQQPGFDDLCKAESGLLHRSQVDGTQRREEATDIDEDEELEEGEIGVAGPAGKAAISAMATGGHTSQSSLAEPPGFSPIRNVASAALPCLRALCMDLTTSSVLHRNAGIYMRNLPWHSAGVQQDSVLSNVSCKRMRMRYNMQHVRRRASIMCRSRAGGGPPREWGHAKAPQEAQRAPREGAPGSPGTP
jgi:hypothetical protein